LKRKIFQSIKDLEIQMGYLPGDCLLAAAFLSYMGPFLSQYREEIMDKVWLPQVSFNYAYT
jgi:dynein heavy chain